MCTVQYLQVPDSFPDRCPEGTAYKYLLNLLMSTCLQARSFVGAEKEGHKRMANGSLARLTGICEILAKLREFFEKCEIIWKPRKNMGNAKHLSC